MSGRFRVVAVVVAVAAVVFVVYRNHHHSYRDSVIGGPIMVLVANRTIQEGTTAAAIRKDRLYTVAGIPRDQLRGGAILSPTALAGKFALLTGKVAVKEIPAGQPLTLADFAPNHAIPTPGAWERAVVIQPSNKIDSSTAAGAHVDVWVEANGSTELRNLYRDMKVLAVSPSDNKVTLRATSAQAGKLIYASTNDRLVIRPHQ